MSRSINDAEDHYTSGGCGHFAYALWLARGRPDNAMIGMLSADDREPFSDELPFDPTHAYLDLPDCEVDVYGRRTPGEMADAFALDSWSLVGPYSPREFKAVFLDPDCEQSPLAGGEEQIREALDFIKAHPDRYLETT